MRNLKKNQVCTQNWVKIYNTRIEFCMSKNNLETYNEINANKIKMIGKANVSVIKY